MDRQLHIFIIDDDLDDVGFLADAFVKALPLTRITVCQNGQQAIDFLGSNIGKEDCPNLAFLDWHMPGKGGYEVLLELKAIAGCEDYPIIMLSTSIMPAEEARCRQAGCIAYFNKPNGLEGYDEIVTASLAHLKI